MGKTNFTKVEEALIKSLDQQTVDQLLAETGKTHEGVVALEPRMLLRHLQQTMKWLLKNDKALHTNLNLERDDLLRLLEVKAEDMKPEDWNRIGDLLKKCQKLKPEVEKRLGTSSDEALIRKERRKHINKRFNVSDKWLPLK